MALTIGLISSHSLTQGIPFYQLQQLQSLHHGLTLILFWVPFSRQLWWMHVYSSLSSTIFIVTGWTTEASFVMLYSNTWNKSRMATSLWYQRCVLSHNFQTVVPQGGVNDHVTFHSFQSNFNFCFQLICLASTIISFDKNYHHSDGHD